MTASDLLKEGKLDAAIEKAIQDVKGAPRNVAMRTLLVDLLGASGQWERAQKHLDVLATQEEQMLEGIASYKGLLDAEHLRAALFARGEGTPQQVTLLPAEPEPLLSALRRFAAGDPGEAKRLLDEAEGLRPPLAGTLDGTPFDDFRDADDRFAGILEVVSQGRYGWLPFAKVTKVEIDAPKIFRDTLWAPAAVTLLDGSSFKALLPVRYPGTEASTDPQLRLGHGTDWIQDGPVARGVGQHLFIAGEEARSLLEIREITIGGASS